MRVMRMTNVNRNKNRPRHGLCLHTIRQSTRYRTLSFVSLSAKLCYLYTLYLHACCEKKTNSAQACTAVQENSTIQCNKLCNCATGKTVAQKAIYMYSNTTRNIQQCNKQYTAVQRAINRKATGNKQQCHKQYAALQQASKYKEQL